MAMQPCPMLSPVSFSLSLSFVLTFPICMSAELCAHFLLGVFEAQSTIRPMAPCSLFLSVYIYVCLLYIYICVSLTLYVSLSLSLARAFFHYKYLFLCHYHLVALFLSASSFLLLLPSSSLVLLLKESFATCQVLMRYSHFWEVHSSCCL